MTAADLRGALAVLVLVAALVLLAAWMAADDNVLRLFTNPGDR